MRPVIAWDVLIVTIPHRHENLCALLAEFDRQRPDPGFGVIAYRTRALASEAREAKLARKMQVLLEASGAEYVCHMDDDDHPNPAYITTIMERLRKHPDYVGFPVLYTVNGVPQQKVFHSLRYPGWINGQHELYRDISHLNPMRRELAIQARFDDKPDHGADGMWAEELRNKGIVKTEEYIEEPMYHYDFVPGHSFLHPKEPWRGPLPERPQYPWLRWIGE